MFCLSVAQADLWLAGPARADPGQAAAASTLAWTLSPPLVASAILLSLLIALAAGVWRYQTNRRAQALLRENLRPDQYQQLCHHGYLELPSHLHPGRCYRIPRARGPVQVYEAGRKWRDLCLVARDPVPYPDLILAQKLLIEADEEAYLAIANRLHPRSHPPALWVYQHLGE